MNQFLKSWPALLILLGGILAAWGSWVSSNRNDEQQDAIKITGEENRALGENNKQLGIEIHKLQKINADVVTHTEKLVEENKQIASDNLVLTNKTKSLTENVETLTIKVDELLDKVHKEITGFNSIPVVSSDFKYVPWAWRQLENRSTGWLLDFSINNAGLYPINSIWISLIVKDYMSIVTENTQLPVINYLHVKENRLLYPTITFPEKQETKYYIVRVRWRVKYEYHVEIFYDPKYTFDERHNPTGPPIENYSQKSHYVYNNLEYKNIDELQAAIEKDLAD